MTKPLTKILRISLVDKVVLLIFLGRKSKVKIRNIKVQTAYPGSSTVDKTKNSYITFNEPTSKISGTPMNVKDSPNNSSRKSFTTVCRQDVLTTSDTREVKEDTAESYGDLVVTDLGSSAEPFVPD